MIAGQIENTLTEKQQTYDLTNTKLMRIVYHKIVCYKKTRLAIIKWLPTLKQMAANGTSSIVFVDDVTNF